MKELTSVEQTLLIPLAARAWATQHIPGLISDHDALRLFGELGGGMRVPRKTCILLALRSVLFDQLAAAYLTEHPHTRVLQVGCGLDSRYHRLGVQGPLWYDLDLPGTIELRRRFFSDHQGYRMITGSLTDSHWCTELEGGEPLLVIAEGVLMYLKEQEVKQVFLLLQQRCPGSRIIFDAYSRMTASLIHRHSSLSKTGAEIQWGIDDLRDLCLWGEGMVLKGEYPFSGMDEVNQLPRYWRHSFRLAHVFPAARRAHRTAVVEV